MHVLDEPYPDLEAILHDSLSNRRRGGGHVDKSDGWSLSRVLGSCWEGVTAPEAGKLAKPLSWCVEVAIDHCIAMQVLRPPR